MDQNRNDDDNLFDFDKPTPPPQEPLPGEEPVILEGGARVSAPGTETPTGGARIYSTEPVGVPPPYTTPPPPYATPPAAAEPPKSNRVWLIVAIVLLVLCCCCVVFVLLMYFVLGDMILEAIDYTGAVIRMFA